MDQITDAMEMVDHLDHPAFCVREGVIVKVNPAGTARMIECGSAVSDLLHTGQEEYSEFRSGCLYLTLSLGDQLQGASVTRKKGFDLFILEQESDSADLQALALAARELREPLTGIMISIEQLFAMLNAQNAGNQEHAAQYNRSLFQMLRLISNMSDASRYLSDTGSRQEIRDICGIIRETVAKAAGLAESAGLRMVCKLHSQPVYSLVDAEKLERAVLNILSNALKFSPAGESVEVTLTAREKKLYFSVLDSGCGIPENLRSGIFSRYTREPGVEDARYGVGLGMVLVRAAASLHGGTVLVDHPQGTGTRVTMTLAIREGDGKTLRSPMLKVDYAGERDHGLLELSNILPAEMYNRDHIN